MGYTQSAISRQVAATEAAVGAVLFERRARGVVPSKAGDLLGRHAGRILGDVFLAQAELDGLREELAGQLATGAFPTAAAVLAPRALAQIAAAHPGLRTTFEEGSTPALLRGLRAGRLEVAVISVGEGCPTTTSTACVKRCSLPTTSASPSAPTTPRPPRARAGC